MQGPQNGAPVAGKSTGREESTSPPHLPVSFDLANVERINSPTHAAVATATPVFEGREWNRVCGALIVLYPY